MTTPPRPTSLDDGDRTHPGAPASDPMPIDSRTEVDARPVLLHLHAGSPPPRSTSAASGGAATPHVRCPLAPTDATNNSMSLTSLILRGLERQSESRPPSVPPSRAAEWELSAGAPSALRSWGGMDGVDARPRVSGHNTSSPNAPMQVSRDRLRRHRLASTLRGVLQMIDDDDDHVDEANCANLFADEDVVDNRCYDDIGVNGCDDAVDSSTRQ